MMKKKKNNKTLIIWALFDDGNCSYKKAIEKFFNNQFIVHCFGINKQPFISNKIYKYHLLDLSLTNPILNETLDEIALDGKPDIILASPPCESWSGADCAGKMLMSVKNCKWEVKNKKFYDSYNKTCKPVKRRNFIQKESSRIIGENTIGATISIIQKYKPKIWVIENPATSKSWEYQDEHWGFKGIINKTYYSAYDKNFSTKPTIFKSNIDLHLLNVHIKGNGEHMAKGSYDKRSAIPETLIVQIVNEALKGMNKYEN